MSDSASNKVVPAFKEDLDCSPIYLGKDKATSSFWFYALKANTARFLKYVNYFHWDRGPQAILELVPLPEEIEQELTLFLEGQLEYEFAKKRSNSRDFTVRKHYRLPREVSNPNGSGEESQVEDVRRSTDLGRTGDGVPISGGRTVQQRTVGRRREHRHAQSDGVHAEPISGLILSERLKNETKDKKPEAVENPPVNIVSIRRKPYTVQGVLELTKEIEPSVNLENSHVEVENGLELERLGLLTPVIPKKRGRPRKV